jgi:hypothetical protein
MARLARAMVVHIVEEAGPSELLRRLSDPHWFQAFGCVLGFDWHSSGVTTTVCAALKRGLSGAERELGLYVCGGKGGRGRLTPREIASHCERISLDADALAYASRMSAKVDSAAVQDGHEVYHHCFVFTGRGDWAVVQQGMNAESRTARRYHWLGEAHGDFVVEPHTAVCAERREEILNLVARESAGARTRSAELARTSPEEWLDEARRLLESADGPTLSLPRRHFILPEDYASARLKRALVSTYEKSPGDFESLLGARGVGAKTLRALALASELIYGERASARDPARFSLAHGGKDGFPFPVDREAYDVTIAALGETASRAKLAWTEKRDALRRLARLRG